MKDRIASFKMRRSDKKQIVYGFQFYITKEFHYTFIPTVRELQWMKKETTKMLKAIIQDKKMKRDAQSKKAKD